MSAERMWEISAERVREISSAKTAASTIAASATLAQGAKKRLEVTAGTMPTHGPLFVALLVGVVVLVGVLNYVPALALGPIVEHLQLSTR